jgi:hypothetical protein
MLSGETALSMTPEEEAKKIMDEELRDLVSAMRQEGSFI